MVVYKAHWITGLLARYLAKVTRIDNSDSPVGVPVTRRARSVLVARWCKGRKERGERVET